MYKPRYATFYCLAKVKRLWYYIPILSANLTVIHAPFFYLLKLLENSFDKDFTNFKYQLSKPLNSKFEKNGKFHNSKKQRGMIKK